MLTSTLKGVFAKNEKEYRLTVKYKRFWSLLTLLLSVFFTIRAECCNFLSFYGRYVLQQESLLVNNNFLLIDATDRSKTSSDQKRLFVVVSLYPLSFFANTPFKVSNSTVENRALSSLHGGSLEITFTVPLT